MTKQILTRTLVEWFERDTEELFMANPPLKDTFVILWEQQLCDRQQFFRAVFTQGAQDIVFRRRVRLITVPKGKLHEALAAKLSVPVYEPIALRHRLAVLVIARIRRALAIAYRDPDVPVVKYAVVESNLPAM